jgi:hypothetical protein
MFISALLRTLYFFFIFFQQGQTCLYATIAFKEIEMFKILINKNADVNIQNNVFFFFFKFEFYINIELFFIVKLFKFFFLKNF